ncbi:MAG TPA: hypothetical protein VGS07_30475 [Thermoanaerobaculia bacterium]|jgi:uncharacterized membrane protein|nr:hypothetical protein [Thermoanaerobaculia bacterium]
MVSTKQFTIFFLLVVVFLVAIMIVTSLVWREQGTLYNTVRIEERLKAIVDFSATIIGKQEVAVNAWINDVDHELGQVQTETGTLQGYVDTSIHGLPPSH